MGFAGDVDILNSLLSIEIVERWHLKYIPANFSIEKVSRRITKNIECLKHQVKAQVSQVIFRYKKWPLGRKIHIKNLCEAHKRVCVKVEICRITTHKITRILVMPQPQY